MVSTTAPNEKLPLPSIKYNNDGTITHIYHKYDDNGQRCKIKRTIDLHRNPEKCKSAIEQRQKNWVPFGVSKEDDATPTKGKKSTAVPTINIPLIMFTDPLDFEVSEQAPPKNENSSIVKNTQSCRICGSSMHWSKDCQFKDVLEVIEPEALLKEEATSTAKATDGGTGTSSTTTTTSSAPGIYVPGSLTRRMGMESSSDDHSLSIRIANLAEHTTEEDVRLLVHKFGKVQRVFMSKNEKGRSRGFAFVNFYEVEAMQQAIQELNGHGYANLILSCERAKKKEAKH